MTNTWPTGVNWDKLKIFYYVAKHKSFSKAAHALDMNQSSISRQIDILEQSLNVKLLIRTPRGISFTEDGLYVYNKTKYMFLEVSSIMNKVNLISKEEEIRIVSCLRRPKIWPYIDRLFAKHPGYRVNLTYMETMPDFYNSSFHIGILPRLADFPNLVQVLLYTAKLGMFASESYLQKFGVPQKREDLLNHRMIGYSDRNSISYINGPIFDWHLYCASDGEYRSDPYISCNDPHDLTYLGKNGHGIFLCPQVIGLENKLTQVLPEIPGPDLQVFFTYPSFLKDMPFIKVMLEFWQEITKEFWNANTDGSFNRPPVEPLFFK
jgi:DNA-binding transcriptional LysR family regulator